MYVYVASISRIKYQVVLSFKLSSILIVTMYAKRQMAYSERMRLQKQEWRVMHRLETRDDLQDLVETWDRIISSISGSRPPSDEDVPQRADEQGMKMDKDMSQEDWHMLFRLAYHAGRALELDLEHDITFEGKRKDDENLMGLLEKRKTHSMDEEENAFVINSEPIEPHLKCDYCDKVCRGSWNASRTQWCRTCCPPGKQCTEGGDNNKVPAQIGAMIDGGTLVGKRPMPRTPMTIDVEPHVPCKRQRGPPSATPPPEITKMINDMRIFNPGADLKAMRFPLSQMRWSVAIGPWKTINHDASKSSDQAASIIDNDDDP